MSRLLLLMFAGLLLLPVRVDAALPPLELAQKSVAQHRTDSVTLKLRVTQMTTPLREFAISGTYAFGLPIAELPPDKGYELKLLWIALLARDPVAEIQDKTAFVDEAKATVGVQDGFVYVYGSTPSVSVYRDLKRLAAFSTRRNGQLWVVRLAWRGDELAGVMITRDGRTVLTARSELPPAPTPPQ